MIWLKLPPYSPDLAPRDFYLFPTIKERLADIQMVDEEHVFSRLRNLLNEIPIRELRKGFNTWIKRLTGVTRGDGSYISYGIKLRERSSTFNLEVQLGERRIDHTISDFTQRCALQLPIPQLAFPFHSPWQPCDSSIQLSTVYTTQLPELRLETIITSRNQSDNRDRLLFK
jgi:hypothetical protein